MKKSILAVVTLLILMSFFVASCGPAKAELGTEENPIIWAVVPSGETERVVSGFEDVAAIIFEETGLVVEPFVATEYAGVIEALSSDPPKAHMASLATFAYIMASGRGVAEVELVSARYGAPFYNGQVFVHADSGIESIDELAGKTFCRADALSTSGWIIPSISLKAAGLDPDTDLADILDTGSHEGSVSGVYNGDCDAGSSYVDARTRVEETYPDVMDKIVVISVSADIPNDGVQYHPDVTREMRDQLNAVLMAMPETEAGAEALDAAYQWSDISWGVPVPVEGWDDKRLYVWFEAVIGYLSATIEYSKITGNPDQWREWWLNPDSKTYYFIGKDNIPFHAIIWPAELMGCGIDFDAMMGAEDPKPFVLPYDVPANEFMNMEGQKISGSRNWGVWVLDYLERYDPDPLRYYLTITMPETRDSDWSWEDFYNRNNGELIATWGNLANRVLGFAYKRFDGVVPDPGELTEMDTTLLENIEKGFETVGELIEAVKMRAALAEVVRLASEVNKYLDSTEPWKMIKKDHAAAGRAIFTAMKAIDSLKTLFAPFLPFTSEKLHGFLNYDYPLFGKPFIQDEKDQLGEHTTLRYDPDKSAGEWKPSNLQPGHTFQKPTPLFKKLEPTIVAEELERIGK